MKRHMNDDPDNVEYLKCKYHFSTEEPFCPNFCKLTDFLCPIAWVGVDSVEAECERYEAKEKNEGEKYNG